jgi:cytochrome b561
MPLRNGEHGYGGVTKALHWLTVGVITGQFLVGYSVRGELDDHGGHGGRDDGSLGALDHGGSLPPWAPALGRAERRLEGWLERALLLLLFAIPLSGLMLVGTGEDDYVPLHVAAHVAFFVAVALHVGLVLKHTVIQRDRHLARML